VALKQDGTVVAWGGNSEGQTTVPAGLSGVVAIAAGWSHTVALKQDGTVVAWGGNIDGQTTVPAGLSGVVAIAAEAYHTVALAIEPYSHVLGRFCSKEEVAVAIKQAADAAPVPPPLENRLAAKPETKPAAAIALPQTTAPAARGCITTVFGLLLAVYGALLLLVGICGLFVELGKGGFGLGKAASLLVIGSSLLWFGVRLLRPLILK
jgi:hypothetical protein